MADSNYDPFRGFVAKKKDPTGKRELGSKLKPVDWSNQAAAPKKAADKKGGWVVFDAKKVAEVTSKVSQAATKVAAPKSYSPDEIEEWKTKHNVTVFGDGCPDPIQAFDELTMLPVHIQASFKRQGFTAPTAIQGQSWPILFKGRDMVGIAKTGSGKTLAFVVPALAHIAAAGSALGPVVLVLAPTRELAQQIEVETTKVLPPNVNCTCIYGGAPKGEQLGELREKNPQILVATPGRLIDFMEIKRINVQHISYLVLDEADRMLDMGFEPQVRAICGQIPPTRQTLMFSATWPKEIQNMAASFQKEFIRIHVGSTELLANPDVKQIIKFVHAKQRTVALREVMDAHRGKRMIIFVKTKKSADDLERLMKGFNYNIMSIHGDKEQRQREYILNRFRKESNACLVATDVAARGLDVKELEVVINFDFAMTVEDYVHRIGRTGRAGAKGTAYTFITKLEQQLNVAAIKELIAILEKAKQIVPDELRAWVEDKEAYQRPDRAANAYSRDNMRGGVPAYSHSSRPSKARGQSSFDPSGGFFGLPSSGGTAFGGGVDSSRPPKQTGEKRSRNDSAGPNARRRV